MEGEARGDSPNGYLLGGRVSELDRLQLQARVWEPAGRALLGELGGGAGLRALDVGCGALGWLRLLAAWVGSTGEVVGTDIDDGLLAAAGRAMREEGLERISLRRDDLFASRLEPRSFNLVHARFQLAPLGRAEEQLAVYATVVRPGGWLIIEEPDAASWRVNPSAPATDRLIALILQAFEAAGGDFNCGRRLPDLLARLGVKVEVRAHVLALAPGHPYLRLPLQFAASLRPRLLALLREAELDNLLACAAGELEDPRRWGTTFTLLQAYGRVPEA